MANDKEAYGAGLATADRAPEGLLRDRHHQQHRHRPDGAELPLLRGDDQGPGRGLLRVRRRSSPTAASRSPRTSTPRCRRRRSSAPTACARRPRPTPRRAACRRHRSADPVHGGDAGPDRLPGRQGSSSPPTRPSTASSSPDPYAIYGYEAMKLGLQTIAKPGRAGRQQVRRAQGAVRDQEPQRRCSARTGSTRTATRR